MELSKINDKIKGSYSKRWFVPADVMKVFSPDFLDEAACRRWILTHIHKNGVSCPQCGNACMTAKSIQRFWAGKEVRCKECGKRFYALTGTILNGCHFNYSKIVLLAILIALKTDPKKISSIMHISTETIRLWNLKFKALEGIGSITDDRT